jgi:hydroxypyruvate reductase
VSSTSTDSDSDRAARADLERIYRAAVAAVDPARLVGKALDGDCHGGELVPDLIAGASRILLLAVGKAAAGMAHEIERRVGDKLCDGIAVVPSVSAATTERALILKKVRVLPSSHPVPDESSEQAAHLACEMLHGTTADDLVIVALSGGASAMFTRPAEGLSLSDKIAVNQALLKAGASIRELNIVRRHLSAVKGGRLLHCPRAWPCLVRRAGQRFGDDRIRADLRRLEQFRRRGLSAEAAERLGARAGSRARVPREGGRG